jgi:bifunctional non-homologous end joining protein LigD
VHEKIKALEIENCPFVNLPDKRTGAWGQGITVEKMGKCHWLKPTTVAEIEFAEWTPDDRLRAAAFIGTALTRLGEAGADAFTRC